MFHRQKLLITGFSFDDSEIGCDVYDANLKNTLGDITAIRKEPDTPTDEEVHTIIHRMLFIHSVEFSDA